MVALSGLNGVLVEEMTEDVRRFVWHGATHVARVGAPIDPSSLPEPVEPVRMLRGLRLIRDSQTFWFMQGVNARWYLFQSHGEGYRALQEGRMGLANGTFGALERMLSTRYPFPQPRNGERPQQVEVDVATSRDWMQ